MHDIRAKFTHLSQEETLIPVADVNFALNCPPIFFNFIDRFDHYMEGQCSHLFSFHYSRIRRKEVTGGLDN